MNALKGKVAIVTGASPGIGRATALLFAIEGAKVVVTARRRPELRTLVDEISALGGDAIAVDGDVRSEAHAKSLVDIAIERYGALDIAFNNAGTLGPIRNTPEVSLREWNDTLETNLTSAFLAAKYQLPALTKRGGSVIFTSTFVGYASGFAGAPHTRRVKRES
ncbi:MAG TPA: SDR family NAD(P)-dependent oxidoreductase [Steroidobacteraceae bacterium]|nr:SDR family NAD(P)-dependent oxidoreductase [Steroidobacteraceae bacterium]